ncbi:MAG: hypothetical protein ACOYXT_21345 [Bacteroidota bacterium]
MGAKKEKFEKRQAFEHDLINRRLTWLFSSQTILFAALALVLNDKVENNKYPEPYFNAISYLGIFISLFIFIATLMGVRAKYKSYRDEKKKDAKTKWGVRTPITIIALIPDLLLPIGFFVAWIYLRSEGCYYFVK